MTEKEYFKDVSVLDGSVIVKTEPRYKSDIVQFAGKSKDEVASFGTVVKAGDDNRKFEGQVAYWGLNVNPTQMFDMVYVKELDPEDKDSWEGKYYRVNINMISYFKPKSK